MKFIEIIPLSRTFICFNIQTLYFFFAHKVIRRRRPHQTRENSCTVCLSTAFSIPIESLSVFSIWLLHNYTSIHGLLGNYPCFLKVHKEMGNVFCSKTDVCQSEVQTVIFLSYKLLQQQENVLRWNGQYFTRLIKIYFALVNKCKASNLLWRKRTRGNYVQVWQAEEF